eukprot:gene12957-biopygen7617
MAYIKTRDCRAGCIGQTIECLDKCATSVDDVAQASISLVYVIYPTVLESFGKGTGNFFAVLLFLMLFMLGWDSAFSMVEAVTTVVLDSVWGGVSTRDRINAWAPNVVLPRCGGKEPTINSATIAVGVSCAGGGSAFEAAKQ